MNPVFLYKYSGNGAYISHICLKKAGSLHCSYKAKKLCENKRKRRGEGERRVSLEAIEKIAGAEEKMRERRAAAEAEGRKLVEDAERSGRALLQKVREEGLEAGRRMLQQAEEQGAKEAERIAAEAKNAGEVLCRAAEKRLDAAAEWIVGKVVKR